MNKNIFFLLSIVGIAASVEISCEYSILNYYMLQQIYSCVIKSVNSPENSIVYVSGSHISGKNNDNVLGLHGNIGNVQKFPKNINNRFKNLIAIYFTNGQIRELSSDDLKPFPNLVELYFDNNQIEVVEEGTFDFNPKLAGISFLSNRVVHINANVFDNLKNLRYLWLSGNPCPNGAAGNDRNAVLGLINTARSSCQSPTFLRMERKLKSVCPDSSGVLDTKSQSGNIDNKIDNLKAQINDHDQNLIELMAAVMKRLDDLEIDDKKMHFELMDVLKLP